MFWIDLVSILILFAAVAVIVVALRKAGRT